MIGENPSEEYQAAQAIRKENSPFAGLSKRLTKNKLGIAFDKFGT